MNARRTETLMMAPETESYACWRGGEWERVLRSKASREIGSEVKSERLWQYKAVRVAAAGKVKGTRGFDCAQQGTVLTAKSCLQEVLPPCLAPALSS
jgi:hypothetical protein